MKTRRFATPIAALAMTAGVAVAGATAAHAEITWNYVVLQNEQTGQCATISNQGYANMQTCGSVQAGQEWNLIYGAPDAGGHAYEMIQNADYPEYCLAAVGAGTGPGQIGGSSDVEGYPCNRASNAVWAMATAAPANGSTHYITFFTFGGRDCLDGGIGLYGFPENGCNPGNAYQVWVINY